MSMLMLLVLIMVGAAGVSIALSLAPNQRPIARLATIVGGVVLLLWALYTMRGPQQSETLLRTIGLLTVVWVLSLAGWLWDTKKSRP